MKLFYIIKQLLFFPHVFLFLKSKNKLDIEKDIYGSSPKPLSRFVVFFHLTQKLSESKYFRTLFYFRTRGLISNLLRIIYPKNNTLIIDVRTKIDGGVILAHPYSTIINAKSIGENLYINQLVTIGEKNGKRPTIGNNVKLYSNCIVIGDITIEDNCVIGAGAVVTKNIPKNSIVVGNPATIIKKTLNKNE